MCYKTLGELQAQKERWEALNPSWTVYAYDDEMILSFLEESFGDLHKEIFSYIPDGPIKSDFWRVCILYAKGGLYVDADIEPLIPLDSYLEKGCSLATCISYVKGYNPHFLLANAGDPLLKSCIDTYIQYYTTKKPYAYWDWSITRIFTIPNFMKKTESGIYIWNGIKIQLLKEFVGKERTDMHCMYKNKRVLNNRILSYDYTAHCFVE